MKSILTIALTFFVSTAVFCQSPSQVVAKAKSLVPGKIKYEYEYKASVDYEGLTPYNYHYVAVLENANISCRPKAKIAYRVMIAYWGSGKYKDYKYSTQSSALLNMPTISKAKIEKALPENFDPLPYIPQYELEAMKSYEPGIIMADENVLWLNEHEIWVPLTMVAERINQPYVIKEKRNYYIIFETQDCGESVTFKEFKTQYVISAPNFPEKRVEEISKTEHTRDEIEAFKDNSVYVQMQEKLAKDAFDNLPPLEIPDFKNVTEASIYAHNLFLTGSKEEVRAFIYKTNPSYRFLANSSYAFNYGVKEKLDAIVDKVCDGQHNYKNEYCQFSPVGKRSHRGLVYYNKDLSQKTSFEFEEDNGKYALKAVYLGYSQDGYENRNENDARQTPCNDKVPVATQNMSDAFATIDLPSNFKKQETKPSRLTVHKYDAEFESAYYVVNATIMDPDPTMTNADRASIAKNTAKQYLESIETTKVKESVFKVNGVKGYEIAITVSSKGGQKLYDLVNRFIYLGDVFYDYQVKAPILYDFYVAPIETFTSTLEGSEDVEENIYVVGDPVMINTGRPTRDAGTIDRILEDGDYVVLVPSLNKRFRASYEQLLLDTSRPRAKKQKAENTFEKSNKEEKEDKPKLKINRPKIKL